MILRVIVPSKRIKIILQAGSDSALFNLEYFFYQIILNKYSSRQLPAYKILKNSSEYLILCGLDGSYIFTFDQNHFQS